MNTVSINELGLIEQTIPITANSTVDLVTHDPDMNGNIWYALLVDEKYYNLLMWKHTIGRPDKVGLLEDILKRVQDAVLELSHEDQSIELPVYELTELVEYS